MPFPELKPLELPPEPAVTWQAWLIGFGLLAGFMLAAILLLRKQLRRRALPTPVILPDQQALRAFAAIPADWSTERCAAAGARILRAYLATQGFGPGIAYPAHAFSGLRSADGWRDLTNLLGEMEFLACCPQPARARWEEIRDVAIAVLEPTPRPEGASA